MAEVVTEIKHTNFNFIVVISIIIIIIIIIIQFLKPEFYFNLQSTTTNWDLLIHHNLITRYNFA